MSATYEELSHVGKAFLRAACEKEAAQHELEATRIESELAILGPEFAEDGIVRTVLRARAKQEREMAETIRLVLDRPSPEHGTDQI